MSYIYFILIFIYSSLSTRVVIAILAKKRILDLPNQRSNHKKPIPVGGGVAIISAILLGTTIYTYQYGLCFPIYLIASTLACATISIIDDIKTVSVPVRLLIQMISVYLLLLSLPSYNTPLIINFVPLAIEKTMVAIALLGFFNIYNFMDGIDGLASSQTIYIATTVLVFSIIDSHINPFISYLCLSIIAACSGFLIYNWYPAKIFMGDVGSITLGLICGWLLLNLAIDGYVVAAIIIPGYYLADSLTTIIKRLIQKKKIWQAHSEHFYQLAIRNGKSHSQVTKKIIYCNLALTLLSLFSINYPIIALVLAILLIYGFILHLTN